MTRFLVLIILLALTPLVTVARAETPGKDLAQAARVRQAQLMSAMFDLRKSHLGFEETISAIRQSASKRGWRVGPTQDAQAEMARAGIKNAPRIKVIPTCPPEANQRIAHVSEAYGRPIPPLPCRITVLIDKDGQVQIIKMNTAHLARAAKIDRLARVMGEIAAEEDAMLKGIVE